MERRRRPPGVIAGVGLLASAAAIAAIAARLPEGDPHVRDVVADVVPEMFPWVAFLSREEIHAFVEELVSTLNAADSLDNPAPVAQVIDAWRHTAEVLAEPELAAALSGPSESDFGPIANPALSHR